MNQPPRRTERLTAAHRTANQTAHHAAHAAAPAFAFFIGGPPRARSRRGLLVSMGVALASLAGCSSAPRPPTAHPAAPPRPVYSALSAEQASDIAIHALGLVGTPYRYGGNTPESGFDCSGLIGYVYRSRAGIAPPRTVAQLASFGEPVAAREARTGDLVIFGAGRPFHAGIYVGEGRFVHAPSTGGTVRLDRLDNRYWAAQGSAFRRP